MELNLVWKGDSLFSAKNDNNHEILLEGSPDVGGKDQAMRPMETLLASLAGCSSIDIVHILRKGRHEVTSYTVKITSERREEIPKYFTSIHLRIEVEGSFSIEALNRAASLAVEKYCSVAEMLKDKVKITYEAIKV